MAKAKKTFDYLQNMKFQTSDEVVETPEGTNGATEESIIKQEEDPLIKVGYMIPKSLLNFIKRCAYWEREDDTTILIQAISEFAKGKEYEPIPASKIKKKRGPKPKDRI